MFITKLPLLMIALIAGCSPLQQAPLVYSSKSTIGIDIATTISESPEISLNIGVKVLDSAYVPVAVSKKVDDRASANGNTMPIEKIEAIFGEGTNPKNEDSLTAENKVKITNYLTAMATLGQAEKDFGEATIQLEEIQREIALVAKGVTELQQLQANTPANLDALVAVFNQTMAIPSKVDGQPLATLQKDGTGNYGYAGVTTRLDLIKRAAPQLQQQRAAEVARLAIEKDQRSGEAQRLLAEAAKAAALLNTQKKDAFSVYGRFDSDSAVGAAKEVNTQLLVGKVFSTGLASQNLTEAVKIEAKTRCIVSLLHTADGIADQTKRQNLIDKLSQMCIDTTRAK